MRTLSDDDITAIARAVVAELTKTKPVPAKTLPPWSSVEYRAAEKKGGRFASAYLATHQSPPGVDR